MKASSIRTSHHRATRYARRIFEASAILGKPLLGQRVADILAVVQALANYPALRGRKVRLAAQGKMTAPAAFAAALSPQVDSLYLSGGLISFRSLVDTENYFYSFANFI